MRRGEDHGSLLSGWHRCLPAGRSDQIVGHQRLIADTVQSERRLRKHANRQGRSWRPDRLAIQGIEACLAADHVAL